MNQKQIDIFNGLIISDGYLELGQKSKNPRLSFSLKHKEFAENIVNSLNCLIWESNGSITENKRFDKRINKEVTTYQIRTRALECLNSFYSKWYSCKKKIVPEDLSLSKEMVLYWYLGDGFLERKKAKPNYRRIGFCTESFSEEENNILKNKLKEILNTDYIYLENSNKKKNKRIIIAKTGITAFYNFLGDQSPVKCYDYKFEFGQYKNKNYFKNSYMIRKKRQKGAIKNEQSYRM